MENLDSSVPKTKSIVGWIFGGLSFVFLIGMFLVLGYGWSFFVGALFAIITIIIGAVKKSTGQIFLGIAGVIVAIFLFLYLFVYLGFYSAFGVWFDIPKIEQVSTSTE